MAAFTPRLYIPQAGNPYYNTIKSGGYNPGILGNNDKGQRVKGLDVLPNCTSYATGRFAEIIGEPRCEFLGKGNACDYIKYARKQGLEIVQRPVVGGCMVWSGGIGGYGHVAIVEMDLGNRFICSESEYYGAAFKTYTRFGKEWADGCYWMNSSYKYTGCIVNPALKEHDMTEEETKKLILSMFPEQFAKQMADYLDKQAKLPPSSDYAQKALDWMKENGYMNGNTHGDMMARKALTREDYAIVEYNQANTNN